ncbi:Dynactin subunit 4 [Intoshia linei]|uniref:Dynactin subunit 4 n=1 Tax=Intoshia linei TaxID=1819745 RepID=A0A177B7U8_9BILA|nr:Dynactin subunit 4 [Intoshia linei]
MKFVDENDNKYFQTEMFSVFYETGNVSTNWSCIENLLACNYCNCIKSKDDVIHEPQILYCPKCFDNYTFSDALNNDFRCKNCKFCSICRSILNFSTQSKNSEQKYQNVGCFICRETTLNQKVDKHIDTKSLLNNHIVPLYIPPESSETEKYDELLDYWKRICTTRIENNSSLRENKPGFSLRSILINRERCPIKFLFTQEPISSIIPLNSSVQWKTDMNDLDYFKSFTDNLYSTSKISEEFVNFIPLLLFVRYSLRCKECNHCVRRPDSNSSSAKLVINVNPLNFMPSISLDVTKSALAHFIFKLDEMRKTNIYQDAYVDAILTIRNMGLYKMYINLKNIDISALSHQDCSSCDGNEECSQFVNFSKSIFNSTYSNITFSPVVKNIPKTEKISTCYLNEFPDATIYMEPSISEKFSRISNDNSINNGINNCFKNIFSMKVNICFPKESLFGKTTFLFLAMKCQVFTKDENDCASNKPDKKDNTHHVNIVIKINIPE